ncbi:hypothetical protein B0H13DRAFT_2382573 [Mycena leptocephala]|nr:hypothetical protein B0H13DRAFT_2382573 [Mycena leptocephala]
MSGAKSRIRLRPRTRDGLATTSISSSRGAPSTRKNLSDAVRARVERFPTFLSSLPAKSPKDTKTQKRPVDAMDVDEEGSAVSNAAESSSKPVERPPAPSCPSKGVRRPFFLRALVWPSPYWWRVFIRCRPRSGVQVVDLETVDIEKKLQINDFFRFRRSPLQRGRNLTDTIGHLVSFYNAVLLVFIAFQYRYSLVEPLDALLPTLTIPSSSTLTTRSPAGNGTPATFSPPSTASRTLQWKQKETGVSGEAKGEAFGVEGARAPYREKIPATIRAQEGRGGIRDALEPVGLLHSFPCPRPIRGRDRSLTGVLPPPAPAPAPRRLPFASPPRPTSAAPVPRARGKAMSAEPDIAVLEQGSNSGSDDVPLSVQRKSKGRRRRSSRDPEIITCTVKVKKGKRQVGRRVNGPKNEYDSQLWHDRNDLFVIDAPTTSTGGNKSSRTPTPTMKTTRGFPYWKRRIALSVAGAYWMRPLPLADNECVRPRYGDETPTAACTHCRADNTTCELSPVEFDWEMTDAALPDVNAEWMELQLTLMLEIAEEDVLEARRAIFGSENSSVAGGKSGHRARSSSRGGEDDETDDSGTEVEGGKGGEDGDVSMGQDKDDEPPLTASASVSGRSSPPSAPPSAILDACFPQRRRPIVRVAGFPSKAPSSRPSFSSGRRLTRSLPFDFPFFGKAGVLLGSKPNETSEALVASGEMLEEGEIDAEGEIVVGTSAGETSGRRQM